jgi:hypothetical protein
LIEVASSESLPIGDKSVDFILTSPPYCTRIDYAVATMPELALIGYKLNSDFKSLRKQLIGTVARTVILYSVDHHNFTTAVFFDFLWHSLLKGIKSAIHTKN